MIRSLVRQYALDTPDDTGMKPIRQIQRLEWSPALVMGIELHFPGLIVEGTPSTGLLNSMSKWSLLKILRKNCLYEFPRKSFCTANDNDERSIGTKHLNISRVSLLLRVRTIKIFNGLSNANCSRIAIALIFANRVSHILRREKDACKPDRYWVWESFLLLKSQ